MPENDKKQTRNGLGITCSFLLVFVLSSCVKQEKLVEVKILDVYQNNGVWVSLIEDGDGMRKRISGKIGEAGDSFKIIRTEFHRFYSGSRFKYLN